MLIDKRIGGFPEAYNGNRPHGHISDLRERCRTVRNARYSNRDLICGAPAY